MVEEFLPLFASFMPNPQRTSSARGRAAWQAYVKTESGELHAFCLERLERDPDATITLEEAAAIVRPWLDPVHAEPIFTGNRIAHHWFNLPEMDAGAWKELQFFIATSKTSPISWTAVELIAERRLRTDQPLGDDLRLWLADMLAGKARRPPSKSGRPKKTIRNVRICAALLVLQQLGLSVTLDDGTDRKSSGCGVVADILNLSHNAVATVWTDARSKTVNTEKLDQTQLAPGMIFAAIGSASACPHRCRHRSVRGKRRRRRQARTGSTRVASPPGRRLARVLHAARPLQYYPLTRAPRFPCHRCWGCVSCS